MRHRTPSGAKTRSTVPPNSYGIRSQIVLVPYPELAGALAGARMMRGMLFETSTVDAMSIAVTVGAGGRAFIGCFEAGLKPGRWGKTVRMYATIMRLAVVSLFSGVRRTDAKSVGSVAGE